MQAGAGSALAPDLLLYPLWNTDGHGSNGLAQSEENTEVVAWADIDGDGDMDLARFPPPPCPRIPFASRQHGLDSTPRSSSATVLATTAA